MTHNPFIANTNLCKNLENDWNHGTGLLICQYSAIAALWIPTLQGLDEFQRYLHPCALDESSLSIGRGKTFFVPSFLHLSMYLHWMTSEHWDAYAHSVVLFLFTGARCKAQYKYGVSSTAFIELYTWCPFTAFGHRLLWTWFRVASTI